MKNILNQELNNLSSAIYIDFEETILSFSNKHAPLKRKILRHIDDPLTTKNFEKKLWKNRKPNVTITKTEVTKTGPFTKNKEIAV